MSSSGEPLKVDPSKLRLAADQLDSQSSGFRTALESACSRAAGVSVGSGAAGAALPGMVAAWESDGTRLGTQFATHAHGHREVADAYLRTDADNASGIDEAGAGL